MKSSLSAWFDHCKKGYLVLDKMANNLNCKRIDVKEERNYVKSKDNMDKAKKEFHALGKQISRNMYKRRLIN